METKLTPFKREELLEAIRRAPTFIKAYQDLNFLSRDELRPIRLQLELLKPEMAFVENNINSTIVVFGSARLYAPDEAQARIQTIQTELRKRPGDPRLKAALRIARTLKTRAKYYEQARLLAKLVTKDSQKPGRREFVIVTGGGPGIMEAANRGAYEVGGKSIGLNITLPHEQEPNPFITPELCFQFHYFALRKMHFLMRSKALVAFPGGYGTMDELFETLTLVQTRKMRRLPIVLFGKEFWDRAVDFKFLAEEGMIAHEDLKLFHVAETAQDAWRYIQSYWRRNGLNE